MYSVMSVVSRAFISLNYIYLDLPCFHRFEIYLAGG